LTELTFTFDLEDPRPPEVREQRFIRPTETVLELLAERNIRATFFVVATTAQQAPQLVRRIRTQGHEVALHSHDHRPLIELTLDEFEATTSRGKTVLEDILGECVSGYRAPSFSLTAATPWVPRVLAELGFSYSSSVLPVAHPMHGYPGAPAEPFTWPDGLLELPAPVTRLGPWTLPYLGGIYFRYLPLQMLLNRLSSAVAPWFYCHPYDFDANQPYHRMHGEPHWVSMLLWCKRRDALRKLTQLLDHPATQWSGPFEQQMKAGRFATARYFSPVAAP